MICLGCDALNISQKLSIMDLKVKNEVDEISNEIIDVIFSLAICDSENTMPQVLRLVCSMCFPSYFR